MNTKRKARKGDAATNKPVKAWSSTDVYLVTGLVIGFVVWLVMGVFLIQSTLKVVGL